MPQSGREKVLKLPFKNHAEREEASSDHDLTSNRGKDARSLKIALHSPNAIIEPKFSGFAKRMFAASTENMRMTETLPRTINSFSSKSPLRSQKAIGAGHLTEEASFLAKNVNSPQNVPESLMQKERSAPRFLSTLMGKGRLVRSRIITGLMNRKVSWHDAGGQRLPHAKKLQLFQTLAKKPLSFLEIRVQFGASKRRVRSLVEKGYLKEAWGPKAIGVRFELTKRGKTYLKELQTAAKYDSGITEKNLIHLKSKAQ